MKSKNTTIYFILFYLWILVVSPHQRFPFLETIHLERIVMLLCWVSLFFSGRFKPRFTVLSVLIVIFYLWLLICYLVSPYQEYFLTVHWVENYWKYIILYFLISFSIEDREDFHKLVTGFVVILFLFQLHSWLDFVRGGSYVYQQGIKRIIGIWTQGIGAANYYGMITLFSLPFALYWYKSTEEKKIRMFLIAYFIMTFLSVGYSGTRGALLGIVFLIIINMRGLKQISIAVLVFLLVSTITYFILPDYLRYRYFSMIIEKDYEYQIDRDADEISRESAQSRLDGLIDGFKLAVEKPITGFGPGVSPLARKLVNEQFRFTSGSYLQLHNLYGQLLSESGFIGTFIFLTILIVFWIQLRKVDDYDDLDSQLENSKLFLQNFLLLMLFYGMASHTLYRYYWFLLFAFHDAFLYIVKNEEIYDDEDDI